MQPRPSMDETLMHVAYVMAARGTCPTRQVGTVIALDGRILATGYNGAPSGMRHCTHAPVVYDEPTIAKEPPCTNAVHSEANAISFAARYGISVMNATLYTTSMPCGSCAKLIIQSGIQRVIYDQEYRDTVGLDTLHEANFQIDDPKSDYHSLRRYFEPKTFSVVLG